MKIIIRTIFSTTLFFASLQQLVALTSVVVHNNADQNHVGYFTNEYGNTAASSGGNIMRYTSFEFTKKHFTSEAAYWGAKLTFHLYRGARCEPFTYIPESSDKYTIWVSKTQCIVTKTA